MTRLFTEHRISPGTKTYEFSGEDAKYLSDILRMKTGEELTLCDQARNDWLCRISSLTKERVCVDIIESNENHAEPPYEAVLYQAFIKGEKMEFVIQKAVELGVSRIVPVACTRSVVHVDAKDARRKIERWQKISLEAARQSGRGMIPPICMPLTFSDAIKESTASSDLVFLPWESEKNASLSDLFAMQNEAFSCEKHQNKPRISFFIGPEGGFDPVEISQAENARIPTVTLGSANSSDGDRWACRTFDDDLSS